MGIFKVKAVDGGGGSDGPDFDAVRRALALLADPLSGIELRALPYGKGITGRWDDPKLFQFIRDHADAKGIYYTLNPVRLDLIPATASTGSKVADILCRRWLLVDVDPKRPPDVNASEAEHQAAAHTANRILGALVSDGWPVPILVDSGNGNHLLWRIDLPNDDRARALVKAVLSEISARYGDAATDIDAKVFNANRISKLPGTWARKGPHTPERPHRLCRIVSAPESPAVVWGEQLQAILPSKPKAAPAPAEPSPTPPASANGHTAPFKIRAGGDSGTSPYAQKAFDLEVLEVTRAAIGDRNDTLNKAAFALGQLVGGGELDRSAVEERLYFAARAAGLTETETRATIRSGLDAGVKKPRGVPEPPPTREPEEGEKTGAEIILDYFRETLKPEFKRGMALVTANGETVSRQDACAAAPTALIELLKTASNAPEYKGGGVNYDALPPFFKKWAPTAWADMMGTLPEEIGAETDDRSPVRDQFRQLVRELFFTQVTLGESLAGGEVTHAERRSLISWCSRFAQPGPWRDIRSLVCWTKYRQPKEGELELRVAFRHELVSQLHAGPYLRSLGPTRFALLCRKYAVGAIDRDDRPHGRHAVILDAEFLQGLICGMPRDDADAGG